MCGGHGYTNDGGICNGPSALGGRRRVLLLWWFEWKSISAGDVGDNGRRSPEFEQIIYNKRLFTSRTVAFQMRFDSIS